MSRIQQAEAGQSLPDLLMADFEAGCKGTADVDMHEVLHAIIGDVLDSVRLAMSTPDPDDLDHGHPTFVPKERRDNILATVEDYIVNNYGGED